MLDRVAFTLFGVWNVYWYGIFIAIGLVLGIALMLYCAKKSGMDTDNTLDAVLLVVPLAIVFARLHYVIWSWQEFSFYEFPEILYRIVAAWDGGMAIYGGIFGGLLGIAIYARWKKIPFFTVTDWVVPSLALGQAIGRWGNYVNQEVYGHVVTNPSLQWFPMAVWIDRTQEFHYATFFYESVGDLLVFVLLFFVFRKKYKSRGALTATYFLMYGILRGFLESLRMDEFIQSAPGVPVNQILSFALAAVALVLLIHVLRHKDKYTLYDRRTALEKAQQAIMQDDDDEDGQAADEVREKLESFVIGGDEEDESVDQTEEAEADDQNEDMVTAEEGEESAEIEIEEKVEETAEEIEEAAEDVAAQAVEKTEETAAETMEAAEDAAVAAAEETEEAAEKVEAAVEAEDNTDKE